MKFPIMVSKHRAKSKAECVKWTPAIKNNTSKNFKSKIHNLGPNELATYIRKGHTIIPAILDENARLSDKEFKYQQVFGLDIDNKDHEKQKLKASGEYYFTLERIKDVCNRYQIVPMMIYETFSSTTDWLRYRVLFVLNDPISDLDYRSQLLDALRKAFVVNGIHCTDPQCCEPSRVFYAGPNVIEINDDVAIDPATIIEATKDIEAVEATKSTKSTLDPKKNKSRDNLITGEYPLVDAIILKDVELYKKLLSSQCRSGSNTDVEMDTGTSSINQTIIPYISSYCLVNGGMPSDGVIAIDSEDVFRLTSLLPLDILLGIDCGVQFSCILPGHEDNHPSANLYQLEDERFVYNCFGCIGEEKYLDVLDVFSRLMGASISEALGFICSALGIIVESEWQAEQKRIIDGNLQYINSVYFQERHPALYKELVRSNLLGQLNFYLNYAKTHLLSHSLTLDGKASFFISIRKASELLKEHGLKGTSIERIENKLIQLCILGFFDKIPENEIPSDVLVKAKEVAKKNCENSGIHNKYRQDFLVINCYSSDLFQEAESYVLSRKVIGLRKASLSREQILRAYGQDAADSLYTQDCQRDHSKQSIKFYEKFKTIGMEILAFTGQVSEKEILKCLRGYTAQEKKKLSGQCLSQFIFESGCIRISVNKDTRAAYNISGKYKSGSIIMVK